MESSTVETEYRKRLDQMSPAERVARSAAMFQWTREQIARQIRAELNDGDLQDVVEKKVKWMVALRLYGTDPIMRKLIQRKLADVSR